MTKPQVSNPELKPKFFWFRLKPEQMNWVTICMPAYLRSEVVLSSVAILVKAFGKRKRVLMSTAMGFGHSEVTRSERGIYKETYHT